MDGLLSTYNHTIRSENANSALGTRDFVENTLSWQQSLGLFEDI